MAGGFSVRADDLDRLAARLTGSVAELSGARVPAWASGQAVVDGAVGLFADAWSTGLSTLVTDVHWCAGQVRTCATAYAECDADAAVSLRAAAQ